MKELWQKLLGHFSDRQGPKSFRKSFESYNEDRPKIFEPALCSYGGAFRAGDPRFSHSNDARRWLDARRRITDHVLRCIAESRWGERLVLRGSRMLRAWMGDAAREPGDLDWVVDSSSLQPTEAAARGLFTDVIAAVTGGRVPDGIELLANEVTQDDIWTYERAPGRRIAFPWKCGLLLPEGIVQVDVVFGEELAEQPSRTAFPVADGGCVSALAASPAQSLAWKLAWLASDSYPQGQDLYDAVLLAERYRMPRTVLEHALRDERIDLPATAARFVEQLTHIDWDNFKLEYPWVRGDGSEWLKRLAVALEPTFNLQSQGETEGWPRSAGPTRPRLTFRSDEIRTLAATILRERRFQDLPQLANALAAAGCDDPEVLTHLRAGGPHTRGCWVIHAILD